MDLVVRKGGGDIPKVDVIHSQPTSRAILWQHQKWKVHGQLRQKTRFLTNQSQFLRKALPPIVD